MQPRGCVCHVEGHSAGLHTHPSRASSLSVHLQCSILRMVPLDRWTTAGIVRWQGHPVCHCRPLLPRTRPSVFCGVGVERLLTDILPRIGLCPVSLGCASSHPFFFFRGLHCEGTVWATEAHLRGSRFCSICAPFDWSNPTIYSGSSRVEIPGCNLRLFLCIIGGYVGQGIPTPCCLATCTLSPGVDV